MRFLILRKADAHSESGRLPGAEMLAAMGRYRASLERAGVLVCGEGLHASSRNAARLRRDQGQWTLIDGPFAESKELIAGFVMIEVDSLQKALRWARACPSMAGDGFAEVEVREVISAADFPPELLPYLPQLPWNTAAAEAEAAVAA